MSSVLRKDLEYVLPKIAQHILEAIEGCIPERRGAYTVREVRAALKELTRTRKKPN